MTAQVINVRFGSMINEETQKPFDWAKIGIIETELNHNDGFAGVKAADLRMSVDNSNTLVKSLHKKIVSGEIILPVQLELNCDMAVKGKDITLTVISYNE